MSVCKHSCCHEFSDLCLTLQNILGYLARPPPPPLLQKCNHPPASLLFLLQSILCQASAPPFSLRRACLHHLRLLLWNFSPARLNSTILNIESHFYWLLIEYPRPQMDSTTSKTNLWLIRAFALSAASWYQCNHHFIIAMTWLPVKSQVPGQQAQCALKYKKHQPWRSISQFSPMRQTQTLPACLQHLLPWDQKYSWLSLVFFFTKNSAIGPTSIVYAYLCYNGSQLPQLPML